MKTTIKFFALLAAVLTFAACEKDKVASKVVSKDAASTAQTKHLSCVTMNKAGVLTVYTYTWNGDLLTGVDMTEGGIHNNAVLTYDNRLRSSLQLFDDNNNLMKEYQYVYDNGLLVQEYQTDHGTDPYQGTLVPDWRFPGDYLNFVLGGTRGLDFLYNSDSTLKNFVLTGYNHDFENSIYNSHNTMWSNGDLTEIVSNWNVLIFGYDYDFSSHPSGVSLGTTTLIPGYNTYIPWRSQWSRHNLTHVYGQTDELWINYTYDSDGYPATADILWTDGSTIHWTFEYND